jgi:hypothetical protein
VARSQRFLWFLSLVAGLLLLNLAIWWFYLRPVAEKAQPSFAIPAKVGRQAPLLLVPREEPARPAVEKPALSLREQLKQNTAPSAKPLIEEAQVTSTPLLSRELKRPAPAPKEVAGPTTESPGTTAPPVASISIPADSEQVAPAPTAAISEPIPEPRVAAPREAIAGSAETPPEEQIPLVWELPQMLREKVLRLKSSVHVYHELTEQRFVIVNMHRYGEGDSLPPDGFRLQRIDRDGVVIDYGEGLVRLPRR